jgi:hypothetical protein
MYQAQEFVGVVLLLGLLVLLTACVVAGERTVDTVDRDAPPCGGNPVPRARRVRRSRRGRPSILRLLAGLDRWDDRHPGAGALVALAICLPILFAAVLLAY